MAETATPPTGGATGWRGLEPASLLINLLPDLWRTVRSGWPLLLAIVVGGGARSAVDLGFLALFLGLSLGRTIIHFLTLRFRLNNGKLEIQSGLLGRRNRVIEPAHIQNTELVQNPFHRVFGLVELRIETAGEGGAEGLLSALSVADATALQNQLRRSPGAHAEAGAGHEDEIEHNGLVEVLGYGVSVGRAGAALVVYGVAQEWARQFQPTLLQSTMARPGAGFVLLAVFVALGYVYSVGSSVIRYYGFRLFRSTDGLRTESGLFTRRRVQVPAGRVQLLRINETVLRRIMGYATVQIETAGSNTAAVQQGAPRGAASEAMIPMVAQDLLPETLDAVLPGYAQAAPLVWQPSAQLALISSILRGGLRWTLLLGLFGHFIAPALGFGRMDQLGGIGLLFGAWTGWRDWGTAGWKLTSALVLVRRGFLSRETALVPRSKVQSVHLLQGPLQRRFGVWQVHVWVAGGTLVTPEITEEDARRIFGALGGESPLSGSPPRSGQPPSPPGTQPAQPSS